MHRRGVLAAGALSVLSGCLSYFEDDGDEITEPGDVEIVWDDLIRYNPGTEEERVSVWGVIKNVGDRELNYIEIRATFFDAESTELETVIENVQGDVSSGEEWPFDVEFPHFGERAAEVTAYELEPATGV